MHPLQASRKRQEFGRPQVSFQCHIIYLNRGGAEGIRTVMYLAMRSRAEAVAVYESSTFSPLYALRYSAAMSGSRR